MRQASERGWTLGLAVAALTLMNHGARADAGPPRETTRTLRYELRALGAAAGEATLRVGPPEDFASARLRAVCLEARTDGLAAAFLSAESVATTWVNPQWLPVRGRWDQTVDGEPRVYRIKYGPEGVLGEEDRNGKPFARHDHRASRHPLDLVSLLAWVAAQPLEAGTRLRVPVFDGRRLFDVTLDAGAETELILPIGQRRARSMRVDIRRGGFRRQAELWVSTGRDPVPLRMVFRYGGLGTVEARLAAERHE
jgi:hypothetical protein